MHRKIYDITYVINTVIQGFWCLIFPIGVGFLLGWLLVNKIGAPSWVIVPFLIVGVFTGLFSMCRFLINAMSALERRDAEKAKENTISNQKNIQNKD